LFVPSAQARRWRIDAGVLRRAEHVACAPVGGVLYVATLDPYECKCTFTAVGAAVRVERRVEATEASYEGIWSDWSVCGCGSECCMLFVRNSKVLFAVALPKEGRSLYELIDPKTGRAVGRETFHRLVQSFDFPADALTFLEIDEGSYMLAVAADRAEASTAPLLSFGVYPTFAGPSKLRAFSVGKAVIALHKELGTAVAVPKLFDEEEARRLAKELVESRARGANRP